MYALLLDILLQDIIIHTVNRDNYSWLIYCLSITYVD